MFQFPALCFFQFKSAQGYPLALTWASFHKCSTVALTNMAKVMVTLERILWSPMWNGETLIYKKSKGGKKESQKGLSHWLGRQKVSVATATGVQITDPHLSIVRARKVAQLIKSIAIIKKPHVAKSWLPCQSNLLKRAAANKEQNWVA